jgi:hypothetical protein
MAQKNILLATSIEDDDGLQKTKNLVKDKGFDKRFLHKCK